MKYFIHIFVILLYALFFSSLQLSAQKGEETLKGELSSEDIQKIDKIMKEIDSKISKVIMADTKNYNAMKSELDKISQLTDKKEKLSAISTYKKKYSDIYSAALKKANVDMNQVVNNLKKMFPKYEIKLNNNNIHIKGIWIENLKVASRMGSTEEVILDDFDNSSNDLCTDGIGGSGYIEHTDKAVTVFSRAAFGKICEHSGKKKVSYKIPKNVKSANLKINTKFFVEGEILGLGGFASSLTSTSIIINEFEVRTLFQNMYVPILWIGTENNDSNITFESGFSSGEELKIAFKARSSSTCVGNSISYSTAIIKDIDTKVILNK